MKVELTETTCIVTREPGDPAFRDSPNSWGDGESRLLYRVKTILNDQGYDLIKKRMHKDGHMVSDDQQYIRTRSRRSPQPHIYIWNGSWQVQSACLDFNEGSVDLQLARDVFQQQGA